MNTLKILIAIALMATVVWVGVQCVIPTDNADGSTISEGDQSPSVVRVSFPDIRIPEDDLIISQVQAEESPVQNPPPVVPVVPDSPGGDSLDEVRRILDSIRK